MAVLVDSSTILALAPIGGLGLLKDLFGSIVITEEVKDEVLVREGPAADAIKEALADWIVVKKAPRNGKASMISGLGKGERSLFSIYRPGDLLIIDDALARRTALSKGIGYTGLLGLLIIAVREKVITKDRGISILERLASGDFHMTVGLFISVKKKIEDL
jgi:hypothetical protein